MGSHHRLGSKTTIQEVFYNSKMFERRVINEVFSFAEGKSEEKIEMKTFLFIKI